MIDTRIADVVCTLNERGIPNIPAYDTLTRQWVPQSHEKTAIEIIKTYDAQGEAATEELIDELFGIAALKEPDDELDGRLYSTMRDIVRPLTSTGPDGRPIDRYPNPDDVAGDLGEFEDDEFPF